MKSSSKISQKILIHLFVKIVSNLIFVIDFDSNNQGVAEHCFEKYDTQIDNNVIQKCFSTIDVFILRYANILNTKLRD